MVPVTLENETVLKWYSRLYDLDVSNFMATLEILKKIIKFRIFKIHDLSWNSLSSKNVKISASSLTVN